MFGLFRSRKPRLNVLTGSTMGTTYTVKIVPRSGRFDADRLPVIQEAIGRQLEGVQQAMSPFLPDSELSQFNRYEGEPPFRLSDETFHVLQQALQVSEESQGVFDITVAPIVNLYGFGPDPFRVTLPSDDELSLLRPRVGYRMLELDPVAKTVRKKRPDIHCDLSGIAKGYGVDRVAALLDRSGIDDYMVEIGGEVRVRGCNAEGKRWQIAIERPAADGRAVHRIIGLADQSIATSGDYRVYYVKGGKRISHTIDPRTGRSVEHDVASVTVICDDCMSADAWATALMVLGPEAGGELAERKALPALFLTRRGEAIVEKRSSAFLTLA